MSSWQDCRKEISQEPIDVTSGMFHAQTKAALGIQPMVFSYATPAQVQQGELSCFIGLVPECPGLYISICMLTCNALPKAKIETVKWKMAQKLAELQSAMGALGSSGTVTIERAYTVTNQTSSLNLTTQQAMKGTIEQVQALVLPPEFAVNGNALGDTSKFVVQGRPQRYCEATKVSVVVLLLMMDGWTRLDGSYLMCVVTQAPISPSQVPAQGNVQAAYETFDEGEGSQMTSKRKVEAAAAASTPLPRVPVGDPAKDLLRRSLRVSYVPVKVEKGPHKSLSTSAHVSVQHWSL